MTNILVSLDKVDKCQFILTLNGDRAGAYAQDVLMYKLNALGVAPDDAFRLVLCTKDLGIGYYTL